MSSVVKTLFGGTDDTAIRAQSSANERTQQFIEQQAAQARQDVQNIMPTASQNLQTGFSSAFDVLNQTIPQQIGAVQQGNFMAQQTLADTLPQIQAAILGQPVNTGAFQPQNVQASANFGQFPNFTQPQAPQPTPQVDIATLLAGLNLGGR